MNAERWGILLKDTCQLTKPTLLNQVVSEDTRAELILLITGVIREYLKKKDLHIGLKIYVNQKLRNDKTALMASDPPLDIESLESWSQRIFGDQKFGMIMNSLEDYSNSFAEMAALIAEPILEQAGLPLGGLSFLFFMGNYGFTPFGVHKESAGEEGFLFHLGPNNKQFYTWDTSEYNAVQHNTQVFHDFEKMLPDAKIYELSSGDAMFIPHQVYHIANTSEFSISFVMDYVNPSFETFESQLALAVSSEVRETGGSMPPLQMNSHDSEWGLLLNHESLKEKLETALRRKILTLKSNGGILKKSKPSNTLIPNGSFSVKGKRIFPIFYEEQANSTMLIFARGHRFSKMKHPKLSHLINLLNKGEVLSFELIKETFQPKWDLIEIFGFIGDLLRVEAITIESH